MSDENLITDEIRARLERDDRVPHPAEVAVSHRRGAVILRGSVGTLHQRRAIVKIARAVPGVLAVEDEPLGRPPGSVAGQRGPRCGSAGADVERCGARRPD
jgi:BON domain